MVTILTVIILGLGLSLFPDLPYLHISNQLSVITCCKRSYKLYVGKLLYFDSVMRTQTRQAAEQDMQACLASLCEMVCTIDSVTHDGLLFAFPLCTEQVRVSTWASQETKHWEYCCHGNRHQNTSSCDFYFLFLLAWICIR